MTPKTNNIVCVILFVLLLLIIIRALYTSGKLWEQNELYYQQPGKPVLAVFSSQPQQQQQSTSLECRKPGPKPPGC